MLITKTNVTIVSKTGNEIPAIFVSGKTENTTVIMAHGLQGSKNEYLETQARIAEKLEKLGIGSLRIDFCGHGDSKRDLKNFTLASQVEDMIAGIEWLKKEKRVKSLVALGISFGAPPAIIVSELFKDIIGKCVLIAPVTDYQRTFVYPLTSWGKQKFGYERIKEGICNKGLKIDSDYVLSEDILLEMLMVDVQDFVKRTAFNISIFHGKCDDMVPIITSENMVDLRNNIKLVELDNTEHGLTEVGDEEFATIVTYNNLEKVVNEIIC